MGNLSSVYVYSCWFYRTSEWAHVNAPTHTHVHTGGTAAFVGFVSHTNRPVLVGVLMTSVGSGVLMYVCICV